MKNRIFNTPWHSMRWFRLFVGIMAISNSVFGKLPMTDTTNIFILILGIYFVVQAIMGWGCAGSCKISQTNKK